MIESQWFSFSITAFSMLFGVAIVVACMVLSWMAMRRNAFKRSSVMLESLRFVLVVMVAVTISQPEWLQKFLPNEEPVLAVLWDDSSSMDTEDVVLHESAIPVEPPRPALSPTGNGGEGEQGARPDGGEGEKNAVAIEGGENSVEKSSEPLTPPSPPKTLESERMMRFRGGIRFGR